MADSTSSQRTFRQRKHEYNKSLEARANELESEVRRLQQENKRLSLPSPPCDPNQFSNSGTSTLCLICRHVLQVCGNGMLCPDSITSERRSDA
jgi:hypothetical protein